MAGSKEAGEKESVEDG